MGARRPEESLVSRVPLWPHTSLRVGGPAAFLADPIDLEEVAGLLRWAQGAGRSFIVLGAGSNMIFSDAGYEGLVLRTGGLRGRWVEGARVRVAAGERLPEVAWWAARSGLAGLEWACGIPGSVGGAVAMNAGAHGAAIAGILASVDVLDPDGVLTLPAEALRLGYRTSRLLTGEVSGVIVEATFELAPADPAACVARARSHIAERVRKLPVGASAGCIFRNPVEGPTAGQLLDRAGCKGLRIGDAMVSTIHANVILNEGTDNAGEVLELIARMKERVLTTHGVELREEVVIVPRP